MPQGFPAAIFPDAAAWLISYLAARIDGRDEPYAADVTIRGDAPDESTQDPWPTSGYLVTVRDDGGQVQPFRRLGRLGINVWAPTKADCADLAALVSALIVDSPGSGRCVGVETLSGPLIVPETSGRHHRYLTAELVFTGAALTA